MLGLMKIVVALASLIGTNSSGNGAETSAHTSPRGVVRAWHGRVVASNMPSDTERCLDGIASTGAMSCAHSLAQWGCSRQTSGLDSHTSLALEGLQWLRLRGGGTDKGKSRKEKVKKVKSMEPKGLEELFASGDEDDYNDVADAMCGGQDSIHGGSMAIDNAGKVSDDHDVEKLYSSSSSDDRRRRRRRRRKARLAGNDTVAESKSKPAKSPGGTGSTIGGGGTSEVHERGNCGGEVELNDEGVGVVDMRSEWEKQVAYHKDVSKGGEKLRDLLDDLPETKNLELSEEEDGFRESSQEWSCDLKGEEEDEPEGHVPASAATLRAQKHVRKMLSNLLGDGSGSGGLSVDYVMNQWDSAFGKDTVRKQMLYACSIGDVDEVRRLMEEEGADPNLCNKRGETGLMMASEEGNAGVVCRLIKAGADLDYQSKDGWTAMHYAAAAGRPLIVELLLRAGAHPDKRDFIYMHECPKRPLEDMGTSPLSLCRRWMDRSGDTYHQLYDERGGDVYYRIQEMLLQYGAKEYIPYKPGVMGQTTRPMFSDSDVDRQMFSESLSEGEKRRLAPELYDEQTVLFRSYMEKGILPDDERYFKQWDKEEESRETKGASEGSKGKGKDESGRRRRREEREESSDLGDGDDDEDGDDGEEERDKDGWDSYTEEESEEGMERSHEPGTSDVSSRSFKEEDDSDSDRDD